MRVLTDKFLLKSIVKTINYEYPLPHYRYSYGPGWIRTLNCIMEGTEQHVKA